MSERRLTLKSNGIWQVFERCGNQIFKSREFYRSFGELPEGEASPPGVHVVHYSISVYSKILGRELEINKRAMSEWYHVTGYKGRIAAAVQVYGDQWLDNRILEIEDLELEEVSPRGWQLQDKWYLVPCTIEAEGISGLHEIPTVMAKRIPKKPLVPTMLYDMVGKTGE
jgi:hypothetical protein